MANDSPVQLRERVKAPPAQALVDAYYAPAVANSIKYVFSPEMRVHLAHALMLAETGIVGRADIARILPVLLDLRAKGAGVLAIDYSQEDLYSYVERHVVKALGPDVGGRFHTGRSRNDLNVTSWRLALRDRLLALLGDLGRLQSTMLDLADRYKTAVMPGYTHTQHAQPISLGYYLLAAGDVLARDYTRLAGALAHCNLSPLGAGALTTTGFPIDREGVARRLGFGGLVEIAYDAASSRDDVHETAAALAILMTGLSRLAADLQSWNTAEFGFIELADQFSSVSSIMPQKKNPQALEYAKAAAAHVTGALTVVLAASKNTSFSDVNDGVSSINVPVLEAVDKTRFALAVMAGVLETMTVHPEVMAKAAADGFGTATELADVVVRESGLSFRMAHNIVGRVVREAIEAGRTAPEITSADLDRAAETLFQRSLGIPADAVRRALDPAANLATRTVVGGPAAGEIDRLMGVRRRALAAAQEATNTVAARATAAEAALVQAAETFKA